MEYLYEQELVSNILDEDVIIVMDTNVWLDLYSLAPATIELIIKNIENKKDLFWLPNQVFIEFNRHVGKSRDTALNRYEDLKSSTCGNLNDTINSLSTEINKLENKGNTEAMSICKEVVNSLKKQMKVIGIEIDKINSEYVKETECINKKNDIILNLVNLLHENSDTGGFDVIELMNIYEEGEKRYKYKISPGYTDESKKNKVESESQFLLRKYGDLILWKEILKKVYRKKTNLIFVQNERKSDWWDKREPDSKNIPRILREEFKDSTVEQSRFIMIDFEEFIYHYGNKFDMPERSIQKITLKLKYNKALIDYLEVNKKMVVEEYISDKFQDSYYDNLFCNELSDISFFGGSIESIEDFTIDSINIINSEVIHDNSYDLRYIESEIEIECTAYITEYVNKYVVHSGRIKVKFNFALTMNYLLNISSIDLEYKDAIELQDTSIGRIEIFNIENDGFDVDECGDEDLFRER